MNKNDIFRIKEVIFVLFLDMLAAFAVAVLSGMGVGGGGLFIIYLVLVKNLDQISAQGINLVFFSFASGFSLLVHSLFRKIKPAVIFPLVIFGILGALLGHFLISVIPAEYIRKIFGVMLIVSGTFALFSPKKSPEKRKSKKNLLNPFTK